MSAATCSRIRTTPTTNSNLNVVTETTVDIKLGNISNMACSLTSDNSLRSSESSDPLESDYSEEADEEEPEEAEAIKHDHNTDDRENDYDYDESAAENEEDNQNDDDANDDTDRGEDVNETGNEGDDNTEDNSDTDTARSLRIYSLDDFQIIKTVVYSAYLWISYIIALKCENYFPQKTYEWIDYGNKCFNGRIYVCLIKAIANISRTVNASSDELLLIK
uniref:Uncharacterized protein n=1 Tax=Glossina pallidipes TaxID=7398 RepID=A0A1B0AFZ3_GLOPL